MNRFKTPITNIIIKIPVIIIAILIFIRDYNSLKDYFELTGNNNSLTDCLQVIFTTSIFRTSFLMLIPLIGIFLKSKIGWLLILSFYYLFLITILYTGFETEFERDGTIVILFFIFILPIVFIGVMNNEDNTNVYDINRSELLKMNIASITIALIELAIILFLNLTQS
ncbi:hypothetical protein [uncultured Winogradskyella sp.]|uniref:hypothetical protein n=1 Tax=uncultured Winogradskyella sp. TaxID=395353 RepID=UPI00262872CF|nr:hypothetical protein [uncultured Winogradskyella sp.]